MTREDRIREEASTKRLLECVIGIIVLLLGIFVIRGWYTTIAAVGGGIVGWLLLDVTLRGDSEQRARIEEARAETADTERDEWQQRAEDAEAQLTTAEALSNAWMVRAIELEVALEEAISQCHAHNGDYHTQTSTELLEQWKHLVAPERRNELIESVYNSES